MDKISNKDGRLLVFQIEIILLLFGSVLIYTINNFSILLIALILYFSANQIFRKSNYVFLLKFL